MLSINKELIIIGVLLLCLLYLNHENKHIKIRLNEELKAKQEHIKTIENLNQEIRKIESLNKELKAQEIKQENIKNIQIKKALNNEKSKDKLSDYFVDVFCSLQQTNANSVCKAKNSK
ncbi:hypothetical protein [Campylobacter sp. RM12637]|uniref:hypothetical protein n=1 Tax=Campylobacter sp. RM12637 TaxID=2735734 RepID=UPI00301483B1|nr:hypothetical protein [Campylobacter sp. RM12637]